MENKVSHREETAKNISKIRCKLKDSHCEAQANCKFRRSIRGLSRIDEGRSVQPDDGVERKFQMWMICESCWRGHAYICMEQCKARKAPQMGLSTTPSSGCFGTLDSGACAL